MSCRRLLADIHNYYKRHNIPVGDQLRKLTPKMLGSWKKPDFKAKAAESGVLVRWAFDFATRWATRLPNGDATKEAGSVLCQWQLVIANAGTILTDTELRNSVQLAVRHCVILQFLGEKLQPKHHMWIHLCIRQKECGCCKGYHCFLDENLNSVLSACCQTAHKQTWEKSVFDRMRLQPFVTTSRCSYFSNM